jgi:hypothetical protein
MPRVGGEEMGREDCGDEKAVEFNIANACWGIKAGDESYISSRFDNALTRPPD